ncbi:MAG: ABC transporter permease [Sphingomonadales bacterium]
MQTLNIIFRSIWKGKFYSLVSVLGLAVAIASVILVATLIRQETSFEDNFTKAEQIYRLTWENPETGDRFATMFNPFSPQMVIDFPEVIDAARVGTSRLLFERPGSTTGEGLQSFEDMAFVDPTFFNIFNFEFLAGDPKTALGEPNSIVLTQAAAEKYFGNQNALGKTLVLENEINLTVRGVISDMPKTTHFSFHFMVNLETMRTVFNGAGFLDSWGSDRLYHYVVLADGTRPATIEDQLPDFAARHSGFEDFDVIIELQPLKNIHFTNDLQDDVPFQDTIKNITKAPRKMGDLVLFSAGAFILVLVASFNFMNLQVARSVGKNRHMGLFKVFGGTRKKIISFILMESMVLSFVSLVLAMVLVEISLGGFGNLLGSDLTWANIMTPEIIFLSLALTVGLALVSGAYPALLIGGEAPSRILKGEFKLGQGAEKARHALVLLQFSVSIVLIIVSFGIYSQISYSLSVPLGFDQEQAVLVQANREARGAFNTIKTRLLENPDIQYVSRASIMPPGNLSDGASFVPEGGDPNNPIAVRRVSVDYDYFEALGIPIVAGRSYDEAFPGDVFVFPDAENPNTTGGIILNETAARRAGWDNPDDAIGKVTNAGFNLGDLPVTLTMTVVGVVPDIHFRSLRSEVSPMAFYLSEGGGTMVVKFSNPETEGAIAHLEQVWTEAVPEMPLSITWLDREVSQLYSQERKTLNLLSSISILAVFVASLGLFAVATLVAEKRTKEVGLRKILGAKVRQIVNLLSWQFLKPVLWANFLAWPLAWFFLDDWLKVFVYRFEPNPLHFLIPGIIAILIAWGTVAGQAYRVARANPINALRYE